MNATINIQKEVNPHFRAVWTSDKPYNILSGGRNSFKSTVVALKLVYDALKFIKDGKKVNTIVIRKVAKTIKHSVYLKIQWAIRKFGNDFFNEFTVSKSTYEITHRPTGSQFVFYGADDFEKLKSNDIGNILNVYYEEAAEFKSYEEFDQINTTFMRQKHPDAKMVKFFWAYNPPRNPYHWINEWSKKLEDSPNHLIHRSSYLDDELGFVTEQMLEEINRIKLNDYDYYRYLYLGEQVGLGANIYNMDLFKIIDKVPDDDNIMLIDIATDSGHQNSATVHTAWGLGRSGNVYLLDTYYYSPAGKAVKKAPSELTDEYKQYIDKVAKEWGKPLDNLTIDSAEGALRNEIYLKYGIRLHPIAKKKKVDMIDCVHSLLAQGRVHILKKPANDIVIEQHKRYMWEEKTIHSDDPRVVKEYDDAVDSVMYYICDNARKLGLKY